MNKKAVYGMTLVLLLAGMLTLTFNLQPVKAYVNRKHGFSIKPPNGWTVDENDAFGTAVIFYGPVMPETGDNVSINIAVETTNLSLEEYVSSTKSQLASRFTDYELVSEGSRNIGYIYLKAYELVGVYTQDADDFKNKQVIIVENGKAFVITFMALPTNYDTYLPTFEGGLQTFEFVAPEHVFRLHILLLVLAEVVVGGIAIGFLLRKFWSHKEGSVEFWFLAF